MACQGRWRLCACMKVREMLHALWTAWDGKLFGNFVWDSRREYICFSTGVTDISLVNFIFEWRIFLQKVRLHYAVSLTLRDLFEDFLKLASFSDKFRYNEIRHESGFAFRRYASRIFTSFLSSFKNYLCAGQWVEAPWIFRHSAHEVPRL